MLVVLNKQSKFDNTKCLTNHRKPDIMCVRINRDYSSRQSKTPVDSHNTDPHSEEDTMAVAYDKYSVTQYSVSSILGYIEAGDIAIPEIQWPFVWKGRQVRDLIDSLYNGYPTGYLIIWQNPDVKLKDGGSAVGKKVLIDGQQRITALMTAIAGHQILTEDYIIVLPPVVKKRVKCPFYSFSGFASLENQGF